MQHHRFNDENPVLQKFNINIISPVHSGTDSQINLETVAKELKNYQDEENSVNRLKEAKMHKYTQSQTRLDIPVIKYIPISPRDYQEFRTERVVIRHEGNQENI